MLRASGSPAAAHRSQNPDTMAVSGVPARPACVSHAESSAKKASFIPRLYNRKVWAGTERVYRCVNLRRKTINLEGRGGALLKFRTGRRTYFGCNEIDVVGCSLH